MGLLQGPIWARYAILNNKGKISSSQILGPIFKIFSPKNLKYWRFLLQLLLDFAKIVIITGF
jgi:hypothetical protein